MLIVILDDKSENEYPSFKAKMKEIGRIERPDRLTYYVKSISGSKPTVLSLVDHSGAVIEESKRKAEVLNLTFKKSFTQEDRTNVLSFDQRTNSEMGDIATGISGVEKQLRELNTKKSAGPNGIPVRFYKDYSAALAPYLACVYRKSLIQRKVPSDWKKVQVTPVYKKGKRTDPHSYRSISLPTYISRKDHKDKMRKIRARTEAYRHSFFPRSIWEWNRKGNS